MIEIFSMFLEGVGDCYSLLDRIQIASGVSVLDFLIAIVVISVIMPVLLTLVRSMPSNKNIRVDKHGSDKEKSD